MITCSFLLPSTVGALYSKVLHSQVKNIRKEKNSTKGSKKQNLNLPHTNNYLLSIYVVLGEGNGHPLQYFLPGKSHGRRSLVGCSPWGRKELDTTE